MKDAFQQNNQRKTPKRRLVYENGRVYFTKETERAFYFVLTLVMLVAGILYKTGIL